METETRRASGALEVVAVEWRGGTRGRERGRGRGGVGEEQETSRPSTMGQVRGTGSWRQSALEENETLASTAPPVERRALESDKTRFVAFSFSILYMHHYSVILKDDDS